MSDKPKRCHGITRSDTRCQRPATDGAFCAHHPTPGGAVTKSGFADLQGVSPSTVTKWLGDGVIDETDGGAILWERASRRLAKARDITATTRRQGEPDEAVKIAVGDDDEKDDGGDETMRRYSYAKMRKMEEQAMRARRERLDLEEELVRRDVVEQIALEEYQRFKSRLLAIPDELPANARTRSLVEKGIRECLLELTTGQEAAEKLADGEQDT